MSTDNRTDFQAPDALYTAHSDSMHITLVHSLHKALGESDEPCAFLSVFNPPSVERCLFSDWRDGLRDQLPIQV